MKARNTRRRTGALEGDEDLIVLGRVPMVMGKVISLTMEK